MDQLVAATFTMVAGVFGCVAYFYLSNLILDTALPARGPRAGRNINRANAIRPWRGTCSAPNRRLTGALSACSPIRLRGWSTTLPEFSRIQRRASAKTAG